MSEPTEADVMVMRNALAAALTPIFGDHFHYALFIECKEGGHCLSNTDTDQELVGLVIPILANIVNHEPDLQITIREPSNG